ncbi:hypothetical protein [Streptomyces sp. NPDC087270]|uniref:hypothetical protein n=1 Tax=Streptomyces sp. NPDC087270 TaxID=3365774 RepID=UPI0037F6E319
MPCTATTSAPPDLLTWGPGRLPVPYVARWSGESVSTAGLVVKPDGSGLAYEDEVAADRDGHGVLWARMGEAVGVGRPDYRAMSSHRQRVAALCKLCQVCGGPADRTAKGWLFLMPAAPPGEEGCAEPEPIEGTLTTKPPICHPCAELAVRHCPHLAAPLYVRSRKPRVWGVFGGFVTPSPTGALVNSADTYMPYGDREAAPWFLASQLALELTRCT